MRSRIVDHREARLLLALLRGDDDGLERLAAGSAWSPETFVELARSSDVHPWVHARLERTGRLALLGEAPAEKLASWRRKCRMDNLLLLARLEEALDALLAVGIEPVVLKGLDVVHRFGLDFDVRTIDDIDLLVHPRDVRRALVVLGDAGWGVPSRSDVEGWLRRSHHVPLHGPGPIGVELELHWNVVQQVRYRVTGEELVLRSVPLEVSGRRVRRLEDHDAAAHLLLHHLAHYFDPRLKWALDLRRISSEPGFSWEVLAGRMRRFAAHATAAMALRHFEKLLPGLLPERLRGRFRVSVWRLALVAPLLSDHPLELFRGTQRRWVRLWVAAVLLESPLGLPGYLRHRVRRESTPEAAATSPYDGELR